MNKHLVFVYGTLLSEGQNPAERMVGAKVIAPAVIPGEIYNVGWFPGYKPSFRTCCGGRSEVLGEIIEVDDNGLQVLDGYEGVPFLYTREVTFAETAEDMIEVFVYVYNDAVKDVQRIEATSGPASWIQYSKENA